MRRNRFVLNVLVSVLLVMVATFGQAEAAQCPAQIDSDDCFANDLQPSGVDIVAGPARCTKGELISATVRIRFENGGGAASRFNVGFYIGDNGEPAIGGSSCTFDSLQPIGGVPDLVSGNGPYLELNGDACGDISKDGPTFRDIQLDSLLCKDDDGDGQVDVAMALSWTNNGNQADCQDPLDPAGFDPAPPKCLSVPEYDLPITVEEPPSISVGKGAAPSRVRAPGGLVRFPVTVVNTSPAASDTLEVTGFVDDLYGDVTGRMDCVVPFQLSPGQYQTCYFPQIVTGSAGDVFAGAVTVTAVDDAGEIVQASDSAAVTIIDAVEPFQPGDLRLVKFAAPTGINEPGGMASYVVLVANLSETTVNLTELEDDLYGNLDGLGNCSLPQTLSSPDPLYICSFMEAVSGEPGDVVTDIVTGRARDVLPARTELQAEDDASVTILDVPADIATRMSVLPKAIFEPGGNVTYTLGVQNISAVDDVTIDSLADSLVGVPGGTCVTPFTLAPGEVYTCEYGGSVSGNADDSRTNVATVSGLDDDGLPVSDRAAASVFILGAPPTIEVRKIALPPVALASGSPVAFLVVVQNTSSGSDPVTLTGMVDDVYGNLDGLGTCSLPQTLQPAPGADASYTCQFVIDDVSGTAGSTLTNTVLVSGEDDEGTAVEGSDQATVRFVDVAPPAEPALTLFKLASPAEVPETGGNVTYTLALINSAEVADADLDLEVTGLSDDLYGDLAGKLDCTLPISLAVGDIVLCQFTEPVHGAAGEVVTDIVTATAADQLGRPVVVTAQASVTVTDVPASIAVEKTAMPTSLVEPGGDVEFTVVVVNDGLVDTVEIDSLLDTVHGDLLANPACSAVPPLAPGDRYTCTYVQPVNGQPGDTELSTVTAVGEDDDGLPVQGSAQATVAILDTPPSITVSKRASPSALPASGGTVEYEVTVTNTSQIDAVELDSLVDSMFGDLDGRGNCSVPQTLAPGAVYSCSFEADVAGVAGQSHRNEVQAIGTSDDGETVAASANAIVRLLGVMGIPATGLPGRALLLLLVMLFAALAVRRYRAD